MPISRMFLAVGYYVEESTDTDRRVSTECTPKLAVAHQLRSIMVPDKPGSVVEHYVIVRTPLSTVSPKLLSRV